jgi:DNA-binding transcriptional ArsR family regulator
MSEEFHETIGAAAGKVWSFLSESGPASATKLADGIGLDRTEVQRAIGWLAREGKVSVEKKGKNEFFSLL